MFETLRRHHGRYRGTNTLYDPHDGGRPTTSDATLEVGPYASSLFQGFRYRWRYPVDGEQDGLLLVGKNDAGAFGYWIDGWHNGPDVMHLRQDAPAVTGRLVLRGSYPAPPGPDWGWTIAIEAHDGVLWLSMRNVSPDGDEEPAVEARFERVG